MGKRLTKQEFINKANKIHDNKYDYSKVCYINSKSKVLLICPIHGEFEILPNYHLYDKYGCDKCKNNNQKYTKEKFIIKATETHGDKYDYSLVVYNKSNENVKIICHKHGVFNQAPSEHIRGKGCHKCNGGVKLSDNDLISKFKKIHSDKYDYSLVVYNK